MNKKELKKLLNEEKKLYLGSTGKKIKQMKKSRHKRYFIFMYLYYFRLCQYYKAVKKDRNASYFKKFFSGYMFRYYNKLRNIYSYKSGVEIGLNSKIGKYCDVWHSGVVINGIVGDNCVFHGNNTLGNKGISKENLQPVIGNNVDIGAGAVIIGDVTIADNCIIGAGSVVTKSFPENGSVIAGVPGKILNQTKG